MVIICERGTHINNQTLMRGPPLAPLVFGKETAVAAFHRSVCHYSSVKWLVWQIVVTQIAEIRHFPSIFGTAMSHAPNFLCQQFSAVHKKLLVTAIFGTALHYWHKWCRHGHCKCTPREPGEQFEPLTVYGRCTTVHNAQDIHTWCAIRTIYVYFTLSVQSTVHGSLTMYTIIARSGTRSAQYIMHVNRALLCAREVYCKCTKRSTWCTVYSASSLCTLLARGVYNWGAVKHAPWTFSLHR